jgi:hypothetical protein
MPPRHEFNDRFKTHIRRQQRLRIASASALTACLIIGAGVGVAKISPSTFGNATAPLANAAAAATAAASTFADELGALIGNFFHSNTLATSNEPPEDWNAGQLPSQSAAAATSEDVPHEAASSEPITLQSKALPSAPAPSPDDATVRSRAVSQTPGRVLGASTEPQRLLAISNSVTHDELTAALNGLSDQFNRQLSSITFPSSGPAAPVYLTPFAQSQKIDQLNNVFLTNAAVNGVAGLTDADLPDSLTASNYLPLTGGSITGDLSLSGVLTAGTLSVLGVSSGGAVAAPYFTATSSAASSTFTNFNVTNSTTTNATSTSLFVSLANFTTGIISTLTSTVANFGTLTATNATYANATTTNLYATNFAAANASFGSLNATSSSATSTFAGGLAVETSGLVYDYSTNRVGIGTESPAADLHVNNSFRIGGTSDYQQLTQINTNTWAWLGGGSGDYFMAWDNLNNRVGIASTTPYAKLSVKGAGLTTGAAFALSDSSDVQKFFIADNGWTSFSNDLRLGGNTNSGTITSGAIYNQGGLSIKLGSNSGVDFLNNSGTTNAHISGNGEATYFSSGNVGIGLTSPTYKLDVSGLGHFTSLVDAANFVATSTTATSTFAGGLAVGSNALNVLSNGYVGMGTLTPSFPLSLGTGVGNKIALYDATSGNGYGLGIQGGLLQIFADTSADRVGIGYGNSAAFTETLSVKGSNVGIGTTSPQSLLHVGDIAGTIRIGSNSGSGDTSAGQLNFVNISGGTWEMAALEAKSNAASGNYGDLLFKTGTASAVATEKMRILYNGNVGIASTTPWAKLSVTNTGTGPSFIVEDDTSPDSTPFIIDASGNVGIGTTSPAAKFSVSGSGYFSTGLGVGMNSSGIQGQIDLQGSGGNSAISAASSDNLIISTPGGGKQLQLQSDAIFLRTVAGASTAVYSGNTQIMDTSRNLINIGTLTSTGAGNSSFVGNLGIGSTTPSGKLTVYSGASVSSPNTAFDDLVVEGSSHTGMSILAPATSLAGIAFANPSNNQNVVIGRESSGGGSLITGSGGSEGVFSAISGLLFGTNSAIRMKIDTLGNVGIGTTTPSSKLDIIGSVRIQGPATYPTTGSGLELVYDSTVTRIQSYNRSSSSWLPGYIDASSLVLNTGSGGNVGIGDTAPTAKLSVAGDIYGSGSNLTIRATSTNGYMALYGGGGGIYFGGSVANQMYLSSAGDLGIASTTPWRTLSVTGTVGFDGLTGSTGAGSLCLDSNKQVVYNSASDNCLSSTRVTKHDINPLVVDALAQVLALQPVSFVYNQGDGRTRFGFTAEDTAAVDPHLVTYDASSSVSGIDDRSIIAILVGAIKDLWAKVVALIRSDEEQNARIARLEAEVAALRSQAAGAGFTPANDNSPTALPTATLIVNGNNPAEWPFNQAWNDNLGALFTHDGQAETIYSTSTVDVTQSGTTTLDYWAVVPSSQQIMHATRDIVIQGAANDNGISLPEAANDNFPAEDLPATGTE